MDTVRTATGPWRRLQAPQRLFRQARALLGLSVVLWVSVACYDSEVGRASLGSAIWFEAPAITETGPTPIEVFTEMHYQQSFRIQEGPRILPPPDSVPVTGRELRYSTMEEYEALTVPEGISPADGVDLYSINCVVCHGTSLKGDGLIVPFIDAGPLPADLTSEATRNATEGALFGFISGGGRQGLALRLSGRESTSPMPEFRKLLSERERWALVQYLRSQNGS